MHVLPRLRRLRVEAGLSQEELALKAGVTRATVNLLEAGQVARVSTIRKLSSALGVQIAELLGAEVAA